jgi:hypothetical protein
VGLAALSLLAEVAEEQPLLCLVDDLQWLDEATGQVLGFVARRLLAEPVALVFAVREPSDEREVAGLPELPLEGSDREAARACWPRSSRPARRARRRADRRGDARQPARAAELPRGMSAAELAAGFGVTSTAPRRPSRTAIRRGSSAARRQPRLLRARGRRSGRRAAAAVARGGAARHRSGAPRRRRWTRAVRDRRAGAVPSPCVRSAAYRSTPPDERRALHAALAEATDPELDPDRRAWHRAQATPGPDEDVAADLEHSAGRASARGGVAAAAAFLQSAAMLTPDPAQRTRRLLAAAQAKRDAGALDDALELLDAAGAGPVDAHQVAEIGGAARGHRVRPPADR